MENTQGRKSRIRVVELSGVTVKDSLSSKYPWSPYFCGKEDCFACLTVIEPGKISCRKPGIGYKITCVLCERNGVKAEYQGETSQTLYQRGKKHLDELRTGLSSNCMVIHNDVHHARSREMHFRMEGIKSFKKPLDRQVNESLRIQGSAATVDIIMNSGSEWRADALPRASFGAPGLAARRDVRGLGSA